MNRRRTKPPASEITSPTASNIPHAHNAGYSYQRAYFLRYRYIDECEMTFMR